ncbi:hypothetical protein [Streptomyces sp. Caat 7-52]|nr:hypothetical protein [Streptomyces sp. Caat 7-52]
MTGISAESEFDLDFDLDVVSEDTPAVEDKPSTGTGTCLSCPVTFWHC